MGLTRGPYLVKYEIDSHSRACLSPIALLTLILNGDFELNPGPHNASIYPCGYCERGVDWGQQALCCDCCDIWYHKTCISMSSIEFEYLDNNSKSFLCFRCHRISNPASRYHGYEVETSNRFSVLHSLDESAFVSPGAPPRHRSSPIGTTKSTRPASITVGERTVALKIIARCPITQIPTGHSKVWWWHARKWSWFISSEFKFTLIWQVSWFMN